MKISERTFKLTFEKDWFKQQEVLESDTQLLQVITKPKRRWYNLLFQYLTLGYYRASWEYKVEVITKE